MSTGTALRHAGFNDKATVDSDQEVIPTLFAALDLNCLPAAVACVGGHIAGAWERILLPAVRTRRRGAVQAEQPFHNSNLNDTHDRAALIATQFYVALFNDGHNVAGTIDTSDPMRHNGHQAGEFVTELAIHALHA